LSSAAGGATVNRTMSRDFFDEKVRPVTDEMVDQAVQERLERNRRVFRLTDADRASLGRKARRRLGLRRLRQRSA
jgi:hypothetical protein